MAETLRNHAAPYREGAWEQFSAKYGIAPKRRMIQWPYWAAAVLLLTAGIWVWTIDWQGVEKIDLAQHDVELPPAPPVAETERPAESVVPDVATLSTAPDRTIPVSKVGRVAAVSKSVSNAIQISDGDKPEVAPQSLVAAAAEIQQADSLQDHTSLLAANAIDSPPVSDTEVPATSPGQQQAVGEIVHDGLFDGNAANTAYAHESTDVARATKKWDLGVAISPSLTSEKINIGGGIAVAYRLSDKFSLGSGLSISEMGVAQNQQRGNASARYLDASATYNNGFANGVSSSYREVTSVTSSVLAMDVPLDLKYHVTTRFYTSVGVSFLTILNEQRTNHYVDRINQPTFGSNSGGYKDLESSVRAVYSAERAAQEPLEGRGYTGFVNFSLGRTMPLSRKLQLSVEPYFKLPIGSLSREDMNFTNGGIRIITGF